MKFKSKYFPYSPHMSQLQHIGLLGLTGFSIYFIIFAPIYTLASAAIGISPNLSRQAFYKLVTSIVVSPILTKFLYPVGMKLFSTPLKPTRL